MLTLERFFVGFARQRYGQKKAYEFLSYALTWIITVFTPFLTFFTFPLP